MLRWVVAALLAALLPACSPAGEDGPQVPATRSADLAALTEALAAHPDPPAIGTELEELRQRAGEVDDDRWLVELMRLTAGRDRDGHTGVFPLAQPALELWPLQLYDFDDGWRVVAALPPYEALVGGRVDAVGALPVGQAAEAVADLVPRDNAQTVRARAAQLLVTPAVLRGVGIRESLTVDGTELSPRAGTRPCATWPQPSAPAACTGSSSTSVTTREGRTAATRRCSPLCRKPPPALSACSPAGRRSRQPPTSSRRC